MLNLKDNKYSLILITDGGESCDGDICSVVEKLLKKKIILTVCKMNLKEVE